MLPQFVVFMAHTQHQVLLPHSNSYNFAVVCLVLSLTAICAVSAYIGRFLYLQVTI